MSLALALAIVSVGTVHSRLTAIALFCRFFAGRHGRANPLETIEDLVSPEAFQTL